MSDGGEGWQAAPAAELLWTDPVSPRSRQFDDIYYAAGSGLAESQYVFLAGNALPNAWRDRPHFTIAETGFGTGLNFLATWLAWSEQSEQAGRCNRLHYMALEKYPMRREDMERALSAWPNLEALTGKLLDRYPPPLPGRHRLSFERGHILLDLFFCDATSALRELEAEPATRVDCWYLDGFAPSRNPDMWQAELYRAMAKLSNKGARFATFSAAGEVRRGLQKAGFSVEKIAGYGNKRNMLHGRYAGPDLPRKNLANPWHIAPRRLPASSPRTAMVLGGGLAGATVANALARRDWQVQVMEQAEIAAAASGNLQGVLYTRLSHRHSDLNSFALHSYSHASRYYKALFDGGMLHPGVDGELCGALHLGALPTAQQPLHATVASLPELVRPLDSAQASDCSGLPGCPPGLFYPGAGWMQPGAVCRALLRHPAIELSEHCPVQELVRDAGEWLALDPHGRVVARSQVAVVATGLDSTGLAQLHWLPLQAIRGQVTHLPGQDCLAGLRIAICHEGYIAPAVEGTHCIGATFHIDDPETAARPADHANNLDKLRSALPGLDLPDLAPEALSGRVAYRCASPDYLPMVGPVPDYHAFIEDYAALRNNARRHIDTCPSYLPGLFVSTAHGSRGLTSTPLAAELIAAQVEDLAWPVDSSVCRALNPARFIIRDLIRNRI
jgi:tRNA 5-methylaminomethyl-2-thiouridine biosynthesis bifunctional protein